MIAYGRTFHSKSIDHTFSDSHFCKHLLFQCCKNANIFLFLNAVKMGTLNEITLKIESMNVSIIKIVESFSDL
jgi:hypothetical protein